MNAETGLFYLPCSGSGLPSESHSQIVISDSRYPVCNNPLIAIGTKASLRYVVKPSCRTIFLKVIATIDPIVSKHVKCLKWLKITTTCLYVAEGTVRISLQVLKMRPLHAIFVGLHRAAALWTKKSEITLGYFEIHRVYGRSECIGEGNSNEGVFHCLPPTAKCTSRTCPAVSAIASVRNATSLPDIDSRDTASRKAPSRSPEQSA